MIIRLVKFSGLFLWCQRSCLLFLLLKFTLGIGHRTSSLWSKTLFNSFDWFQFESRVTFACVLTCERCLFYDLPHIIIMMQFYANFLDYVSHWNKAQLYLHTSSPSDDQMLKNLFTFKAQDTSEAKATCH